MKRFLVTTTPLLDGIKIQEYLGVVNANIVIGANVISDFAASLTDFFGGTSDSYQKRMNEMYESAIKELKRKTMLMGGNAIVSFNVDFDELSGKGKSMFMLSATGTACVANLNEDTKLSDNGSIISADNVKRVVEKNKILKKLSSHEALTASDCNQMLANPSCDYLEYIFQYYYPIFRKDGNLNYSEETKQLVSLLQEQEVVPIVYKYYPQNKAIAKLIIGCSLFDPKSVLDLLSKDKDLAIDVLAADKPYYNMEDVAIMEQIIKGFEELPDIATHTKGKLGLFGKETDIIICPYGHKYLPENNCCPTCGTDVRGLTIDDREIVENFKTKVQVIKKELSGN